MQEQPSVTRFLMLGALETVLNQALELEARTGERLSRLHGTVVRLRCVSPPFSLYLLICEDGVEILENYEGRIDVRVRASLGALVQLILTAGATPDEESVQVSGPQEKVDLLILALQEFDLWSALRRWLDEHVRVDQVVAMLRREDPRWLEKLHGVADSVSGMADEIGRQRLLQEEILDEIRSLKRNLRRERQLDMLSLFLGVALMMAAFATASGQLPLLILDMQQGAQSLFLASVGLTVIFSRMLFGHRYS
ncbi:MAG: SCP2 sterol-binding domain-containing protein [Alcanivoracaceae bacterium]|nr:SCP2 sterol-binding domain-containing protein [Alcanivoracaceae bacterium]